MSRATRCAVLMLSLLLAAACGPERELPVPDAETAAARYGEGVETAVSGNVLELRVALSDELLRGGPIWERSAPYFYLFSTATRDLFVEFPGLAAVRVVAETPTGETVATATLVRETLSEPRWRHAIALAAVAQTEGTARPRAIEELIYWGEDHTEFEYRKRPGGS